MGVVSQKLRDSARGQACTFQIVGICNHDPATTVLAHLPSEVAGRATKSDDWHAAFSCSACHEEIDQHRLSEWGELYYCFRALYRTQKIWRDAGLIVIAGDNEKPRKPSKKSVRPKSLFWPVGMNREGD